MVRSVVGEEIRVRTLLDPDAPHVFVDRNQLEQVMVNLVMNARDAMPGGGDLRIEVRRGAGLLDEPRTELAVVDNGAGMTPEVRAHAFDPFFTTKPPGGGTGLGLSTVYGIVRQAGGHVEIESEPGKGTRVLVSLPAAAVAPTGGGEVPVPAPVPIPGGTETILLVEDNAVVRSLTAEVLRQAGYRVVEAEGGAAAERYCERNGDVDLVICDVVIPGANGWVVRERLAAMADGLPFLFISGYPAVDIARRGIQTEDVAFLPKPFRRECLLRRVRAILDDARASRG